MEKGKAHKKKGELGQSFVEFAFVLPVLLIILAGVINLGVIYMSYNALKDATQEGANYASVSPKDTAAIEKRVRAFTNSYVNLTDTSKVTVTITPQDSTPCAGETIKVKATTSVDIFTPFVGMVTGQKVQISGETVAIILTPACK